MECLDGGTLLGIYGRGQFKTTLEYLATAVRRHFLACRSMGGFMGRGAAIDSRGAARPF